MNHLKERRMELGMTQPQIAQSLRKDEPRIDTSMVSRYEAGICLPTPEQLKALEAILQADRTELYERSDIDLLPDRKHVRIDTAQSHAGKLRRCYRISREFAASMPKDLLDVCNYSSWQSWHDAALKRLLAEYAARKKVQNRGTEGKETDCGRQVLGL